MKPPLRKVPVTDLAYPITLRDGTILTTIAEATSYMLALPPDGKAMQKSWQHAAKLIMEGASATEITKQVEFALFADKELDLVQMAKAIGNVPRDFR